MFDWEKHYKKPEIVNSCFNSDFIDEQEQDKAELQIQETIDFIANLFTPQELQKLNTENKSFKDYLLENTEDLYPSIVTNPDIEEYIGKLKSENHTVEELSKTIKENLFVNKTTFIFNKKMELEIKEFFKNPLRLQSSDLGLRICFWVTLMSGRIPESIRNKLGIPAKNDEMTFEEQLFARYRASFYRYKWFSFFKNWKALKNGGGLFEELQNKPTLNSLDKQKLLIYIDGLLFPKNMFASSRGKIRKFLMRHGGDEWNFETHSISFFHKLQPAIVLIAIFMFIIAIVSAIAVGIFS